MPTNIFFNNFKNSGEQQLLENLVIESIKIYGQDMFYVPRKLNNYDGIYGADDSSSYEDAYMIEMYIKSVDGFTGDGNFLSKFGIEIRDQIIFSMSQRIFTQEVGVNTNQPRPNEGDLIYFPLNNKCFQIKFVNKFEMFYQLGALQTWEVTCELFEYSNEKINTGIKQIDSLMKSSDINLVDSAITDENGNLILDENNELLVDEGASTENKVHGDDAVQLKSETNEFIDFTKDNPFSENYVP